LYNNEISDGKQLFIQLIDYLVCQYVNTQMSRDPSRAASIRPEFELGIYEFTWPVYEFELENSDFRAFWNAALLLPVKLQSDVRMEVHISIIIRSHRSM